MTGSFTGNSGAPTSPVRVATAMAGILLLVLSATLGYIFIMFPIACCVMLLAKGGISNSMYQHVTNFLISTWLVLPPILNQICFGTRLRIFYPPDFTQHFPAGIPEEDWNLVLMNHRTRLDWFYIWLTFLHANRPSRMASMFKIVLKASLQKIPGFGWSMQMTRFLFLRRSWDKDKLKMEDFCTAVMKNSVPHSVLIFPEGTDYEPNSQRSSNKFAAKMGLDPYEYVLHPRVTGTVHLMRQMRARKCLDRVVNITVLYPDTIPINELTLLTGRVPRQVWYFVDVYSPNDIPGMDEKGESSSEEEEEAKICEWLKSIWEEKEELLRTLYTGQQTKSVTKSSSADSNAESETVVVPSNGTLNSDGSIVMRHPGVSSNIEYHEQILGENQFVKSKYTERQMGAQTPIVHYAIAIFWTFYGVFAFYTLVTNLLAQLIAVFVIGVTVFMGAKHGGGWDDYEFKSHRNGVTISNSEN